MNTDVPFSYSLPGRKAAPIMLIEDIKDKAIQEELKSASVKVFLAVKGQRVTRTSSKYSPKPVSKKECKANDQTGVIKVVMYDLHVNSVTEDATYLIQDATVKAYDKNIVVLSCGTRTAITRLDENIQPTLEELEDLTVTEFQFLPQSVAVNKNITCPSCQQVLHIDEAVVKPSYIKCTKCNAMSKAEMYEIHYDLKLQFKKHEMLETVMMYRYQVQSYFAEKNNTFAT